VKLRDYQERLLRVCIDKNSLLYLPTGSGKTLIAVAVIDHFSDDLKRPLKEGGRRSLFLVNTVCLGQQVAEEIKTLLGVKVACWNSETHKKSWSKERYHTEFENNQVFVATAQLFLDAVKHSFISIDQINVVVFDECHHGRMNHPYHELMKQFQYIDSKKHPRIIGLSGMLIGISSKISQATVKDELHALESTFLSTIVTVHRMQEYKNVLLHSTNPTEGFLKFGVSEQCELTKQIIQRVSEIRWELSLIKIDSLMTINPQTLRKTKPKKLKELSLLFEDFKYELKEMGIFGGYLSLSAIRVQFELVKKQPHQHRQILKTVDKCLGYVKELMKMIEDEIDVKNLTPEEIILNSSLKVRTLVAILKKKFTDPSREKDLQCLVFMKRRFTAKCFYHLLKQYAELDPEFPIKPDFVVGVNAELPESIDDILSNNYNKFAIERFRMKETNCVCTSSVMEEGMDLQACNLVVMYDYPMTFRSYQQTKGRARSKTSDYIVLLPSSTAGAFLSKRDQYEAIDIDLKKILIGKTCDRELSIEGIEKERLEQWEPLITERRALLNNISSVALLNRYVSRFANANVLWDRKDFGPKTAAIVRLPIQTKIIHPIQSDIFDDIKTAKQNAAFKACLKLYELGELDENLMPKYS
jgi:endoribonuclease Dicer